MPRLLNAYLKSRFNTKVYKIALSTGCTCPNRDGKISYGGCTFCSEGGSGEFGQVGEDIDTQITKAIEKIAPKLPKSVENPKYIAYFQSFTNTYTTQKISQKHLEEIFTKASLHDEIAAISIGTRPDSLSDEMIEFLSNLNKTKPVWVELGLQTIHDETARKTNRGYALTDFEATYKKLKSKNLEVIVHTILYLPGETEQMMEETIKYLANLNPKLDGIKIQLLQILKNTKIASQYDKEHFYLPTMEEYCSFVKHLTCFLPEETVLHRITGDGPKSLLVEPKWCGNKRAVLNEMKKHFPLG